MQTAYLKRTAVYLCTAKWHLPYSKVTLLEVADRVRDLGNILHSIAVGTTVEKILN